MSSPSSITIDADWLSDPRLQRVLNVLAGDEDGVRVVGGAVRNALLGLPVTDIDVAATTLPDEMVARCEAADLKVIPTGLQHGTVTVVHDGLTIEATSLREDVATDGRHATVAPTRDWKTDAERRDFTINALYCDAAGVVFDPVGGLADIAARRVRFVGEADQRIAEDYLRVLRYFRFHSQLGIPISSGEDFAACVRALPGMGRLSAERVSVELRKMLATVAPEIGIRGLLSAGMLPYVLHAVPRITRMERVCDVLAQDDIKIIVPEFLLLGALAVEVPEDGLRLQDRLRLSVAEGARLARLGERVDGEDIVDLKRLRALIFRDGADAVADRLVLYKSRHDVPAVAWQRAIDVLSSWRVPVFPIRGSDVMAAGLSAGPDVGRLLGLLRESWIDSDFALSEDDLRAMLTSLVAKET